jgi:DNA-binding NarL/FixJ family response regulator
MMFGLKKALGGWLSADQENQEEAEPLPNFQGVPHSIANVGRAIAKRSRLQASGSVEYATAEGTQVHDLNSTFEALPRSVLLLEDDAVFSAMVTTFLGSSGFKVTQVSNGAEGLRKLLSEDFDAIVCDMVMPSFPGDKFYLAVSKTKPHLCDRFIFITGHKGDRKIDEFIRSVRGIVLWKPFQLYELVERIRLILQKVDSEAPPSSLAAPTPSKKHRVRAPVPAGGAPSQHGAHPKH